MACKGIFPAEWLFLLTKVYPAGSIYFANGLSDRCVFFMPQGWSDIIAYVLA
jgi:hypothetical protein